MSLTGTDLAARLSQPASLDLAAVRLYQELSALPLADLKSLPGRRDEIETAMNELSDHMRRSQKLNERCAALPPIPSHTIPAGI